MLRTFKPLKIESIYAGMSGKLQIQKQIQDSSLSIYWATWFSHRAINAFGKFFSMTCVNSLSEMPIKNFVPSSGISWTILSTARLWSYCSFLLWITRRNDGDCDCDGDGDGDGDGAVTVTVMIHQTNGEVRYSIRLLVSKSWVSNTQLGAIPVSQLQANKMIFSCPEQL